jgi:hypothetical protein
MRAGLPRGDGSRNWDVILGNLSHSLKGHVSITLRHPVSTGSTDTVPACKVLRKDHVPPRTCNVMSADWSTQGRRDFWESEPQCKRSCSYNPSTHSIYWFYGYYTGLQGSHIQRKHRGRHEADQTPGV